MIYTKNSTLTLYYSIITKVIFAWLQGNTSKKLRIVTREKVITSNECYSRDNGSLNKKDKEFRQLHALKTI